MSQTISTRSTNAPEIYRDAALTNVDVGVYNGAGELTGWNIINPNTSDVYVKFYNNTSGDVTVGTTTVIKTLYIPAQSTVYLEHRKGTSQQYFSTGIVIACVTGLADSSTTAPTTAIYCEIFYEIS